MAEGYEATDLGKGGRFTVSGRMPSEDAIAFWSGRSPTSVSDEDVARKLKADLAGCDSSEELDAWREELQIVSSPPGATADNPRGDSDG